jgi:hypothetical protein
VSRGTIIHRLISLLVTLAVPAGVFWVNGEIRIEFIVLGLALGFAYWYWGPSWPPI